MLEAWRLVWDGEEGVGGGGAGEAKGLDSVSVSVDEVERSASSSHESAGAAFLILGVALEFCESCSLLREVWRACAEACAMVLEVVGGLGSGLSEGQWCDGLSEIPRILSLSRRVRPRSMWGRLKFSRRS